MLEEEDDRKRMRDDTATSVKGVEDITLHLVGFNVGEKIKVWRNDSASVGCQRRYRWIRNRKRGLQSWR